MDARKTHSDLNLAGFRSLATAAGLLQLVRELHKSGVIDDDAIDRIREAMIAELLESVPRGILSPAYEDRLRNRLKALLAGSETLNENVTVPSDASESSSE